jgi:hypothetical protein
MKTANDKLQKDDRYNKAKVLLENEQLKTLDDLYNILPKSVIAVGLGMNPTRFSNYKSKSPGQFKLEELILLAEQIDTDLLLLVTLFRNTIDKIKEKE